MKKFLPDIYNATLIFFTVITLWSIFSFFTWHTKPLPEKLPEEIEAYIDRNLKYGEALFLSSELLDRIVLNYPDLNIFPAGGNSLQNASHFKNFYIVSRYQPLNCRNISKTLSSSTLVRHNGFKLVKCKDKEADTIELYASSFIERFVVTVGKNNTPITFSRGMFSTGGRGWQRISAEPAFFDGRQIFAINAHPLDKNKKIKIKIPPVEKNVDNIAAGFGIADSGVSRKPVPVIFTASQKEKSHTFQSVDGKWTKKPLKGFLPEKEIEVTIKTENSGRRHFYFDIIYIKGK